MNRSKNAILNTLSAIWIVIFEFICHLENSSVTSFLLGKSLSVVTEGPKSYSIHLFE